MAYSIDISKTLAEQFAKFATLNRHQLAGHVANLDFWIDELRHCLKVIDEYKSRFERMKSAQNQYAADHKTQEFDLRDPCCIRGSASPPKRVDHKEIKEARQTLCDALYRFILRCYNESLIVEKTFTQTLHIFEIGIEPTDLKH
jgi:hypothetical protein